MPRRSKDKITLPLVLVSASPRRQALLQQVGIPFLVHPSEVDEQIPDQVADPMATAITLARQKARAVAKQFPRRWLLAADTLVVVGHRVFGKPQTPDEAVAMLRQLSGRSHWVVTGLCLAQTDQQGRIRKCFTAAERTKVTFRPLSDDEIAAYVATGEPMDKAGAYGIQGKAAVFVTQVVGCYYNVVGLPLAKLTTLLKAAGIDITQFWVSRVEADVKEGGCDAVPAV